MTYTELKTKAKELGIPYNGVSRLELEKAVNEAAQKPTAKPTDEPVTPEVEIPEVEIPEVEIPEVEIPEVVIPEVEERDPEPEKPEANTAIVFDGAHEVRRYHIDIHGEDFAGLANEFSKKRGYQVRLEKVEAGIVCPHCGKSFRYKKAA